ncbi:MAG: HK97 family phage prohead protease [Ramlibacter sp.]
MNIERKRVAFTDIQAEAKGEGDVQEMRFKGYGAVFGNVDSYGDVIEPGAFAKSLAEAEKSGSFPSMLLQHGGWGISAQDLMPVGVWDTLKEDAKGLASEGILAPIQRGQEAYTLLKMKPRPAITGLSIGYIPRKFTTGTKPEEPRRLLHEVELIEVSLVTFPANGKARVTSVKSEGFTERDFERLMQDAGLSRSEARVVINHGFKHLLTMQDAGSQELSELAAAIQRNTQLISN